MKHSIQHSTPVLYLSHSQQGRVVCSIVVLPEEEAVAVGVVNWVAVERRPVQQVTEEDKAHPPPH